MKVQKVKLYKYITTMRPGSRPFKGRGNPAGRSGAVTVSAQATRSAHTTFNHFYISSLLTLPTLPFVGGRVVAHIQ